MSNAVIARYARTPFHFARKGKLTSVRPATGARIIGKAAQILKREGRRFALATQCIGGGQGIAAILEAA
jgi:Thiolase, C-terminal domain